jgi:hypothetical protein
MCDMFCYTTNDQLITAVRILVKDAVERRARKNGNIEFTYPMAQIMGHNVYLGYK